MVVVAKSFTQKLIARFPTSHLMYVMGFCHLQYWLQGDAKENFNQHLTLIKAHYCSTHDIWNLSKLQKQVYHKLQPKSTHQFYL
jgi:hypothetical protein